MAKNEAMLPTSRGTVALVNLVESPMAQDMSTRSTKKQ
jgi:hypothetical protein